MGLSDIVAIGITAAGVLIGILVFAVKKLVEHRIEYQFGKYTEELKHELGEAASLRKELREAKLRAHKELSRLVYYSRKVAQKVVLPAPDPPPLSELNTAYHDLEATLVSVRFDLEEAQFERLHRFKTLLLGILARAEPRSPLSSGAASHGEPPGPDAESRRTYGELDALHGRILSELKAEIEELADFGRHR